MAVIKTGTHHREAALRSLRRDPGEALKGIEAEAVSRACRLHRKTRERHVCVKMLSKSGLTKLEGKIAEKSWLDRGGW